MARLIAYVKAYPITLAEPTPPGREGFLRMENLDPLAEWVSVLQLFPLSFGLIPFEALWRNQRTNQGEDGLHPMEASNTMRSLAFLASRLPPSSSLFLY